MAVSIRTARATDLDFLVEGNARMAAETAGHALDRDSLAEGVAAVLGDPGKGCYYVADDGEEPIGQLLLTREWSDWRCGWIWWIQSVYVRPVARGQGVFTRLYRHVRDQARRDPEVCGLRLYVDEGNDEAVEVCRRCGLTDGGYRVFEIDLRALTAT